MTSRLPIVLLAAIAVIAVLVVVFGSNLRARTAAGGDTVSNTPAPYTITKTADSANVEAGSQIGYTIELTVDDTNDIVWYIEDALPSGPGLHWTVESFSGDAVSCSIVSHAPDRLECVSDQDFGPLHIIVHVVSPTTIDSPGDYTNEAFAGYPGFTDISATAEIHVYAKSPTPTPSPTPSPTASPTPAPVPPVWGGGNAISNAVLVFNKVAGTVRFIMWDVHRHDPCVMSVEGAGSITETVDIVAPLTNGHFDMTVGNQRVQGDVTEGNAPFAEGDVTIEMGNQCENTEHFDAEPAGRALLQGDIDCSWVDLFDAGTVSLPQGPTPPNPKQGITVKDVINVLSWAAGFEEDSPVHCPKIGDLLQALVTATPAPTATPVRNPSFWGDVDCGPLPPTPEEEAALALELMKLIAQFPDPSPTPGCVKVGKFFLLDK